MTTEAGFGAMHSQGKECPGFLEAAEGQGEA